MGQSELNQSGFASASSRKTGRPIFIEFSKYSFFTPQVPSWPAQRSTVVGTSLDEVSARKREPDLEYYRMARMLAK